MKAKLPLNARFFGLLIFALCLTSWIILIPASGMFADANEPTVTASSEPSQTPIPDTSTPIPPTETPYPYPQDDFDSILGATPVSESSGGLSTINRVLLALLALVTVLVIGVIVYLVFRQTREDHFEDSY